MLRTLRIRDFVIVRDLTVEFGPGLNLLTGETGAGKSILVDALALLAGMRADRSLVRARSDRAVVEALFDLDGHAQFRAWAADRGIETADGGQVLVQRELAATGAGRVLINGSPSTVQLLREVGEWLLELHGQGEHTSLLEADRQTELLDAHGGHGELVATVGKAARGVRAAVERLEALSRQSGHRTERIEELRRTIREIEAAAPRPGEMEDLERERRLLQNAERVVRLVEEVVERAYDGEPSAADLAAAAAERAEALAELDPALAGPAEQLRAAAVELQDAGAAFRDYRDRRDFDPDRLETLESRKAAISRLCLRHAVDEGGLIALVDAARAERSALEAFDEDLAHAAGERREAEQRYADAAAALTASRRAAGPTLAREVQAQLHALALPGAGFEVALRPVRGEPAAGVPLGAGGAERAEFLLAANPGEPLRPLAQAASGGELSRVMLALHVVAEISSVVRALVFDEVDAGVGGAVADAVGARLAHLARRQQVLCVTHLAQVAAHADRHFRVKKRVEDGRTVAEIEDLTGEGRVEELARMIAGKRPTEASRRHAAELLGAAERPRTRRGT